MSIISIRGVHRKTTIEQAAQSLKTCIGGPFEPLNFVQRPGKKDRELFIRLSETLDPSLVVEKINSNHTYRAMIPHQIPDLPLAKRSATFGSNVPPSKKPKFNPGYNPNQAMCEALRELFNEVQYRYPDLYNISRKTGHKLLNEICTIIYKRLIDLMNTHSVKTSYELTKNYRKAHPHFGDFQMVLSTLHALQDASGAPRLQLQESELAKDNHKPISTEKVHIEKRNQACNTYNDKVCTAIKQHVATLDYKILPGDDENTVARKKVRHELNKIVPYLSLALKQVVATHFLTQDTPHRRMRIYGEPYLPSRDVMEPFLKKYVASRTLVKRSPRMFNVIALLVPQEQYNALRAMEGTIINGAKLVIRDSDIPIHPVPMEVMNKLGGHFEGQAAYHADDGDVDDFDDDAAGGDEDVE